MKIPKPKPLVGKWKVWYQVTDVLSLSLEQATKVLKAHRVKPDTYDLDDWWQFKPRTLYVDIEYPLERGVRLTIKPMTIRVEEKKPGKKSRCVDTRSEMTVGYFLWSVAKEYERIYKEHEKYGVWGHAIEDLGFETIHINKNGVVDLFIGS